jgi:hypothetical protein
MKTAHQKRLDFQGAPEIQKDYDHAGHLRCLVGQDCPGSRHPLFRHGRLRYRSFPSGAARCGTAYPWPR